MWNNTPPERVDNTINKIPNTPVELEKIWVKIVEWKEFNFNGIPYKYIKISFHGQPLNIPLFSKDWEDISNRISSFLTKMTHESCREELWWLSKSCSVDVKYKSSGKSIGIDNKNIITPKDFSDFVGISIIWGDPQYEWMRKVLAEKKIYPSDKTMIEDFVKQWDSITTEPLYTASWKQDTLAKLAQGWSKILNTFLWKPQQDLPVFAGNPPTDGLRKKSVNK